jgi:uncharacterized protein (DUF1501 family)
MRRREFLSAAGGAFVSLGHGVPRLFAQAAAAAAAGAANDHVLVVVELNGGNDGLNTLIPFEDPLYYTNRRTLGIPAQEVVKLNDRVALHPKLAPLGELFKQGRVVALQGVGYPNPDRSHFRSMEIWHTASVAPQVPPAGWLGRFLDATRPATADPPLRGLGLSEALPQALRTQSGAVPVIGELEALIQDDTSRAAESALMRKLSIDGAKGAGPLGFLRQQAEASYRAAETLQKAAQSYRSTVAYPEGELGGQLRRAAQVLAGDTKARVLFASQGGYDTHATQADTHGAQLDHLAQSLAAFDKDMAGLKLADRVVILVFSEFGRRVDENASRGTDHGAASCAFLVGSKVKGGLAGQYPSLEKLGEGDLIHTTDFRSVYATLLTGWLGCPAEKVLGERFPALDVIAPA